MDYDIDRMSILKSNRSKDFAFAENYLNPFNPVTTISFELIMDGKVKLPIYDSNGKAVNRLININLRAGQHSVDFSGKSHPSGLYFYQL